MSAPDRYALVDRDHPELSIRQQCELLGVARSGVYRAAANDDDDLSLMCRIDELFTTWPFLGSRRLTAMLRMEGHAINRKRVRRLMRKMGIAALGPKPRLSKPAPGHKIFPYLLRGIAIEQPNQRLPERLCRRPRGPQRHRRMVRILQQHAPTSGAR
jgi:putative transposase